MKQLELITDLGAYDLNRGRKTRPSRHVGIDGKLSLACGHRPLPTNGEYVQLPLSFKAILQLVDCPSCRKYLMGLAVIKVIAARNPVSNTGVNYPTTGVETHDNR